MIRLAGAAMVVSACALFGFRAAEGLEKQYRQLQDLFRIICMLQSEIGYARSFLSEALLSIADTQSDPYASWLRGLSETMEQKGEGDLPHIWEEEGKKRLAELAIPQKEKEQLYSLGRYLGTADVKMQISHLTMYTRHLEERMQDMRLSMQTQKKLYRILGMSGGILLAVLLI